LDAGTSDTLQKPFELIELVGVLSRIYTPIATNKNLVLNFEFANFEVDGDRVILQQLLGNLISNAIQYTSTGSILAEFTNKNGYLHIKIEDTGHGIDAISLEKIFDEFFRVDSTRNMHDGLGLGLSIVKRLCRRSNIELAVESTIEQGTIFSIQTKCAVRSIPKVDGTADNNLPQPNPSQQESLFATKSIAIFEDDPTIFSAYEKALTQNGFYVISLSEDSTELTNQLANINHIDCILSDYRLRSTTGDLIIQQLRDSFGVDIPAIIITADTSPKYIQLFNDLNIKILYKPIAYSEIVDAIKKLIA
jgi:DNA-binding response OmpR family regulator